MIDLFTKSINQRLSLSLYIYISPTYTFVSAFVGEFVGTAVGALSTTTTYDADSNDDNDDNDNDNDAGETERSNLTIDSPFYEID